MPTFEISFAFIAESELTINVTYAVAQFAQHAVALLRIIEDKLSQGSA